MPPNKEQQIAAALAFLFVGLLILDWRQELVLNDLDKLVWRALAVCLGFLIIRATKQRLPTTPPTPLLLAGLLAIAWLTVEPEQTFHFVFLVSAVISSIWYLAGKDNPYF